MEKRISCCGTICSECEFYPADYQGCEEIEGKVSWLEYTRKVFVILMTVVGNRKNMLTADNVVNFHAAVMNAMTRQKRRRRMRRIIAGR